MSSLLHATAKKEKRIESLLNGMKNVDEKLITKKISEEGAKALIKDLISEYLK